MAVKKTLSAAERLAQLVENRAALHEELLLSRQVERELTEALAQEVLDAEPIFDGETPPVVAFNKRFGGSNSQEYSYAAIAVQVNEDGDLMWYTTGPRSTEPKTWADLVAFMGVIGLSSLEILR